MMKFIDLTGQRFERLVVERRAPVVADYVNRTARWFCRCDCGAEVVVGSLRLRQGNTKSCGCLQRDVTVSRSTRHGLHATPEYRALHAACDRCRNTRNKYWRHYGGRGIEYRLPEELGVATRLLIEAIGARPPDPTGWRSRKPYYSLDRINNDGHYEIGNLRWATWKQQAVNQRPRSWPNGGGES